MAFGVGAAFSKLDRAGIEAKTKTASTQTGTTTTENKSADLSLTRSVTSDILGMKAKGLEYDAAAASQKTSAAGYGAEIESYDSSARVSDQNALYSKVSGEITELQSKQDMYHAIGTQRAGLAGAGFSDSADIVSASLRTGYLDQQMIRTQSLFDQGGYLEQAAASRAQSTAAGVAKQSALDTAGIYEDAATQAKLYGTNATTGLSSYLSKFNLPNTTAEGLLSGENVGGELATAAKVTSTTSDGSTVTEKPVSSTRTKLSFHGMSGVGMPGNSYLGVSQVANEAYEAPIAKKTSTAIGSLKE